MFCAGNTASKTKSCGSMAMHSDPRRRHKAVSFISNLWLTELPLCFVSIQTTEPLRQPPSRFPRTSCSQSSLPMDTGSPRLSRPQESHRYGFAMNARGASGFLLGEDVIVGPLPGNLIQKPSYSPVIAEGGSVFLLCTGRRFGNPQNRERATIFEAREIFAPGTSCWRVR
jgi:hypothetical protein